MAASLLQILIVLRPPVALYNWPELGADLSVDPISHSKEFLRRARNTFQHGHAPDPPPQIVWAL